MPAILLSVDPRHPEPDAVARAARILRAGGLVAFPTETVYGLGADALDPDAVARIFEAKGRPASDPIIVHVLGAEALSDLAADVPPLARTLAEAFWPGPLTLILPRGSAVPRIVTAGLDAVAIRAPAHPVARALLQAVGRPLAAPSANPFGRTSPTSALHVQADLGHAIDMIVDAGPCPLGLESTVLDLSRDPPRVLRPGGLSLEALRAVYPGIEPPHEETVGPSASPGTLARHYAPRARLVLAIGDAQGPAGQEALAHALLAASELLLDGGIPPEQLGLLLADEDPAPAPGVLLRRLGPRGDADEAARRLFASLRELDAAGAQVILARDFGSDGLGPAIRDRLGRAAEGRRVNVGAGHTPSEAARRIAALAAPPRPPAA